MKNKIFNGITLALLAAAVIACAKKEEPVAEAAPAADAAQIKTEIQALETSFADGMNTRKSEEIVYYADDATSYSQNKQPFIGKEAIHKNMAEEVAQTPKGSKILYTTNEVFPSADGNQVVELGSYKVSDSASAVIASGNFMAMFQKRDGKYVCVRDMGTSDLPKK
jgi:ketosteroid isomerase-like protein